MQFSDFFKIEEPNYRLSKLTKGKNWYIYFYAYDPKKNKLKRYRVRLNKININDREQVANRLIEQINEKLMSGWSPFVKEDNFATPLLQVLQKYESVKFKELKGNSLRSYKSFLKVFKKWILENNKNIKCSEFKELHASSILLDIRENHLISNRTYNNYLAFFKNLFYWLEEHNFVEKNPFEKNKKLKVRKNEKNRTAFTREEISELFNHLKSTHYRFFIICILIYYCLLRPDDIVKLKKKSFDLDKGLIFIEGTDTKNSRYSRRVIPQFLDKYLRKLHIDKMNDKQYVFADTGNYTMLPATKQMCPRKLAKYWNAHVRKDMNYGLDKKLYSLKDTGITFLMADGVSPAYVQKQADHTDLTTTTKYIHNETPEQYAQLRFLEKEF